MNLNRCEQTRTATGYFIATPRKIYLSIGLRWVDQGVQRLRDISDYNCPDVGVLIDADRSSIRASLGPEPVRCHEKTGIAPAVVPFEWNRISVGLPCRTDDETRWRYEGRVMLEPSPSSHLSDNPCQLNRSMRHHPMR